MNRLPRYLFITLLATCGLLLALELADYAGFYTGSLWRMILTGTYLLICFTSYRWMPDFLLAKMRVRKTLFEEEDWLHPICHELALRTNINRMPEILILEDPEPHAFAIGRNTIVLSRGILVNLSEPEIKAILAHEYGHLINRDTQAGGAFATALFFPLELYRVLNFFFRRRMKKDSVKKRTFSQLVIIVLFVGWLTYQFPDLMIAVLFLFVFWKLFPRLQMIVIASWSYFCRQDEYRQDRFAQSLGCGRHLKSALLKCDRIDSEDLVPRIEHLFSTHPMLYARIRRLEWLDGLRPTP